MLAATDQRPRLPAYKDAKMSATSTRTADKMERIAATSPPPRALQAMMQAYLSKVHVEARAV